VAALASNPSRATATALHLTACERHARNPARNHFPREVFFFGFGFPEVAVFAVPGLFFLPFAAIASSYQDASLLTRSKLLSAAYGFDRHSRSAL
jgi:hypothetical protein